MKENVSGCFFLNTVYILCYNAVSPGISPTDNTGLSPFG